MHPEYMQKHFTEAHGWYARILQHAIGHKTLSTRENYLQFWHQSANKAHS